MSEDIYSNNFVKNLFDSIAGTYDKVNAITSFGLSKVWRKKFISKIAINENDTVLDIMSGMGECWPYVFKKQTQIKQLSAVDLSPVMVTLADAKFKDSPYFSRIENRCEDIFETGFKEGEFDVVISGFGLKTLDEENTLKLAEFVSRVLKPGGRFTFIEMSVPRIALVRPFFMFYLKQVLPFVGKLCLGNPDNYRMLGIYTERYKNSAATAEIFRKAGLNVNSVSYTFGCSGGFYGTKYP